MLISYQRGQGSIVLRVKILDSSATTGAGKTGLTSSSSGLIISTIADNESSATAYTQAGSTIETITTLGTYAAPTATKCRFKEVDATNHKGIYEIQIADARFAVSSAKSLLISLSGVTGAAETDAVVPLTDINPYDAVRAGLTALPNAAAGASTGLPLSVDSSGRVDVLKINGTSQTARDIGASVLLSSGTGTGQITLSSGVTSATLTNTGIDNILDRTDGVESSWTLRQALRIILSALAGKVNGAATTTINIRDMADSKNRISATVDGDGNRSAITRDAS